MDNISEPQQPTTGPDQPAYIPSQAPPGQFQPGYDPRSTVAQTRRNWAPCYITVCSVLLVLVIGAVILAVWLGRSLGQGALGGILSLGTKMTELQTDVNGTPQAQAIAMAEQVTSTELAANPQNYEGKWIVMEGVLASQPTQSQGQYNWGGSSSGVEGMTYVFNNGMLLAIDVSGAGAVGSAGDTVRIYGKPLVWDFSSMKQMPFIGKAIEEEMKQNPQAQNEMRMVFIICNKVELVQSAAPAAPSAAATDEASVEDGQMNEPSEVPEETEPPAL